MIALGCAVLGACVWLYLLTMRGQFWRADVDDDGDGVAALCAQGDAPAVVVVIPARNEAEVIAHTLRSIAAQDYAGSLRIVLVDDHSEDGTAAVAREVAGQLGGRIAIEVLRAPALEPGWTGKLAALNAGVSFVCAQASPPRYLWFTDADIRYTRDALSRTIARAEDGGLVLVSCMARLRARSFLERALVPAFVFFFQMLYPFRWVNDARSRTAAAAGGCVLVRRDALAAAGGLSAIRSEIIDDCALARRLKRVGPIWLGLSARVESVRAYEAWGDMRQMITRCAFAQLRYSPWILAGTVLGMVVAYVVPVALALFGHGAARVIALLTWLVMTIALQPTLARFRLAPLWGVALPLVALVYLALTLDSAVQYCRGTGGMWKGRPQAAGTLQAPGTKRVSPRSNTGSQ